jgi:Rad3-related DNA helicase
MPKVVQKVDEIIDNYPTSRGIVHTHNFRIAKAIVDGSKHSGRILFQNNFKTKEAMLEVHGEESDSIIVAPAMHQGLDLRDDLSRFQVICKVPWPNFKDDLQMAKRVEIDRRYYVWLTALKLVQSYGRSIRSDEDWADTFVLDEGFLRFLDDADKILPGWFREAVLLEEDE